MVTLAFPQMVYFIRDNPARARLGYPVARHKLAALSATLAGLAGGVHAVSRRRRPAATSTRDAAKPREPVSVGGEGT